MKPEKEGEGVMENVLIIIMDDPEQFKVQSDFLVLNGVHNSLYQVRTSKNTAYSC